MFNDILWIVLIIHIVCSLICCILIIVGRMHLRGEYIIPIFFVPVFGPILALCIELLYLLGKPGQKVLEVEALKLENDIYWKPLKHGHENKNVVPLEESILINDFQTRRKAMFEIQEHEPINYLDVLMIARENDDVETVHYATTQISKEQKRFQLELQKYAVEMENDPHNIELLDAYIGVFEKYLDSGLLEENLLRRERFMYGELLDKRLALTGNDRQTLIKKLRNAVSTQNFTLANEISDLLKQHWSLDEDTWIETLRVSVESNDRDRLQKTLDEIRHSTINWTKSGREMVRYWIEV